MVLTLPVLIVLIGIGVADLVLLALKKKTISQRYHKLFPQWVDSIIMVVALVLIWMYFGGATTFTPVMLGTVMGHLFWHENG